jgi:porphobilinogen synthase
MHSHYCHPANRPRRLRRDARSPATVRREHRCANDLILPVFVLAGQGIRRRSLSMPASARDARPPAADHSEECVALRHPVMALFPVSQASLKTEDHAAGARPEGLVPTVVRMS